MASERKENRKPWGNCFLLTLMTGLAVTAVEALTLRDFIQQETAGSNPSMEVG